MAQRRGINPRTANNEGRPSPSQLTASHKPSPSSALKSPAAQRTPITTGTPNTFQKLD